MSDIAVPTGWVPTELSKVLLCVVGGGTPSRKISTYFSGAIPWFTVKDMKVLKPNDAEEHITEVAVRDSATNLIPANTLIVATRISLGKAIRPTVACAINQDLKALIVGSGINSIFLLYWVGANERTIQELGSGTTVSGIRLETLNSLKILLPPAAEQTRIVEKLEELLTDLDAGVAELNAAQKKLAQYRQSLLKAAVEGVLTAEWRAERKTNSVRPEPVEGHAASSIHPSTSSGRTEETETGAQLLTRILTERRIRWEEKQLAKFKEQGKTPPKGWQDKYPEPVKPDTTNLPELPEGWVWASVDQLGDVQLGRQRSPDKLKGINPTRYIRAANITEQGINFSDVLVMDFSSTEKDIYALKTGDILLTEASGSPEHVGRPVIWPEAVGLYCFQNTVIRFVPHGIESDYPFRIFQAWQKLGKFRQLSGGVGINHLSAGKFSTVAVPLPSLEEQEEVVLKLAQAFSLLEEQTLAVQHSLKQSAAQRKNILKSAFSGQLVPQNPNDEPASVLLDRIRAERASRAVNSKTGQRGRKQEAAHD